MKKKDCESCKHREFDGGAYLWCLLDKKFKFKYDKEENEDGCKYYKRDIDTHTSSGFWKMCFIGDEEYIWHRGKFRPLKLFTETKYEPFEMF